MSRQKKRIKYPTDQQNSFASFARDDWLYGDECVNDMIFRNSKHFLDEIWRTFGRILDCENVGTSKCIINIITGQIRPLFFGFLLSCCILSHLILLIAIHGYVYDNMSLHDFWCLEIIFPRLNITMDKNFKKNH